MAKKKPKNKQKKNPPPPRLRRARKNRNGQVKAELVRAKTNLYRMYLNGRRPIIEDKPRPENFKREKIKIRISKKYDQVSN